MESLKPRLQSCLWCQFKIRKHTLSAPGCQRHSQSKDTQVFQRRCCFLMGRIYCSITLLCKSGKSDLAVIFSKQIQLYILHLSLLLCSIKYLYIVPPTHPTNAWSSETASGSQVIGREPRHRIQADSICNMENAEELRSRV